MRERRARAIAEEQLGRTAKKSRPRMAARVGRLTPASLSLLLSFSLAISNFTSISLQTVKRAKVHLTIC